MIDFSYKSNSQPKSVERKLLYIFNCAYRCAAVRPEQRRVFYLYSIFINFFMMIFPRLFKTRGNYFIGWTRISFIFRYISQNAKHFERNKFMSFQYFSAFANGEAQQDFIRIIRRESLQEHAFETYLDDLQNSLTITYNLYWTNIFFQSILISLNIWFTNIIMMCIIKTY